MVWNVQRILKLNGVRARAIAALIVCSGVSIGASAIATNQEKSPPARPAPKTWRITFQMSGGVIGMDRHLELESSGALKVVDRQRSSEVVGRLPDGELTQIAGLVTALKPDSTVRDVACRDCLQYDLNVHDPERSLAFRLNDATITGASAEQLVRVLTSLVNRELTKPRTP